MVTTSLLLAPASTAATTRSIAPTGRGRAGGRGARRGRAAGDRQSCARRRCRCRRVAPRRPAGRSLRPASRPPRRAGQVGQNRAAATPATRWPGRPRAPRGARAEPLPATP
jgi:hypothetical protein